MAITPIEPDHPGIHFTDAPGALDCTTRAIHLACTQVALLSMTPAQRSVFRTLCCLQMADAGPHSLLPPVLDALLALAQRPWWDAGVAGLPDEAHVLRG